ncbi:hypothetical protein D9756_003449 [Leucocoprinus leucothites]|uniref:G domain-containing protein n=1 Tax=Leucocoprinus leucothites TaxID=201217 RepID=A0A8H5G6Q3_9AGAR|nr:hypothetical protein D9756_003449 [Leucoagaricus leucothites]
MAATPINATKGVRQNDIIVAFMGPTGSGKSFFIDLLTGQVGRRAGNTLKSVTSVIEATRMPLPGDPEKRDIVLVDTPGFDDTTRSDMEILSMISEWLKKTYESSIKLSGLIYLHRITDNRMAGSPYKNLRMFGELCGDLVMTQVVLVTTMWERVAADIGRAREEELKASFWKALINRGSNVDSLKTATPEEAWRVVQEVVDRRLKKEAAEVVLLQEELVDNGVKLNETHAGKALYTDLQKQLAEQKESMKSLIAQVEKSNDPHLTKELKKEYDRIQKDFDRTFLEAETLKRSLLDKIMSFLFSKATKSSRCQVHLEAGRNIRHPSLSRPSGVAGTMNCVLDCIQCIISQITFLFIASTAWPKEHTLRIFSDSHRLGNRPSSTHARRACVSLALPVLDTDEL